MSPPKLLPENAQYTLASTQKHKRRTLFAKMARARLLELSQNDATVQVLAGQCRHQSPTLQCLGRVLHTSAGKVWIKPALISMKFCCSFKNIHISLKMRVCERSCMATEPFQTEHTSATTEFLNFMHLIAWKARIWTGMEKKPRILASY